MMTPEQRTALLEGESVDIGEFTVYPTTRSVDTGKRGKDKFKRVRDFMVLHNDGSEDGAERALFRASGRSSEDAAEDAVVCAEALERRREMKEAARQHREAYEKHVVPADTEACERGPDEEIDRMILNEMASTGRGPWLHNYGKTMIERGLIRMEEKHGRLSRRWFITDKGRALIS